MCNLCKCLFEYPFVIHLDLYLKVKLWDHIVILCLTFGRTNKWFSMWLNYFTFPWATSTCCRFTTSLPTLPSCRCGIELILEDAKYRLPTVVLLYGSPMTNDHAEHIFNVLVGHFGEMPIQDLCLFFKLGCLSEFNGWLVRVLYVFWIIDIFSYIWFSCIFSHFVVVFPLPLWLNPMYLFLKGLCFGFLRIS